MPHQYQKINEFLCPELKETMGHILLVVDILYYISLVILMLSSIYYCYTKRWKYLIWLLIIGLNPIILIWITIKIIDYIN